MTDIEPRTVPVSDGRKNHWLVDNSVVVVAPTAQEAEAMIDNVAIYDESDLSSEPLDQLIAQALENIKKEHARMLELFTNNQTVAERDTWPVKLPSAKDYDSLSKINDRTAEQEDQYNEERDYLAGSLGDDDLADAIAAGLEPARVMADRILEQAEINKELTKRAENVKQTANRAIREVTTHEEFATTIADLKVKEAQAIADFQAMLEAI